MNQPSRTLSPAEIQEFAQALTAIEKAARDDLGQQDVDHIRAVIRVAHYCEIGGRVLLHVGIGPMSFIVGTGALGLAKVLENMEIGHNVMHGQYDWTGEPDLNSRAYEWDNVCTSDHWRHSHNYEHHTFTNILGKDRDIGYGALRVTAEQPWHPAYLAQPVGVLLLAAFFQWGVGMHDLHIEEALRSAQGRRVLLKRARPFLRKAGWQLFKDYGLFPLLSGLNAPRVLAGNALANLIRNVWSFAVIFCGHFPEGVRVYTQEETVDETRGDWYLRQLNGSANFDGPRLVHILSGHLSHQIEHHLFPDIPAHRYPEMSVRVREVCEHYGQVYNTRSLGSQLKSVAWKILRHTLPSRPARRQRNQQVDVASSKHTRAGKAGARRQTSGVRSAVAV